MQPCALCKEREADKTGSHVVPAFMLVSLIGKRNKEVGFEISSAGYVKKHIGREVSAEAIHELLDRELSEDDLEENENPFVVDNLLCSFCESRLSVLESGCAPELRKLKDGKLELKNADKTSFFEMANNLEIRCLFYSIVFRIAATSKFEYNLNATLYERIRGLLDKVLSTDIKEFTDNLKKFSDELASIPVSIFYAPLTDNDDGGNQIYSHKPLSIPSFVIINEFIVCTYNKMPQINFDFGSVFSIDKNLVKATINFKESVLKIGFLESRKKINDSLNKELAHKMNQNIGNLFREVSVRTKGIAPSNAEIHEFVKEVALDETELFDKLKPEFLAKVMKKHLE
jgi:hypothetical protein